MSIKKKKSKKNEDIMRMYGKPAGPTGRADTETEPAQSSASTLGTRVPGMKLRRASTPRATQSSQEASVPAPPRFRIIRVLTKN